MQQEKNEEEKLTEFFLLINDFLEEHLVKGVSEEFMYVALIAHARIKACRHHENYFDMLGILTHLMTEDIGIMWNQIKNKEV